MKILFLSSFANPASGASTLFRLAKDLKKNGHTVLIVTTDPSAQETDLLSKINSSFIDRILDFLIRISIDKIMPSLYRSNSPKIRSAIKRFGPDIVSIHWTHGHVIPLSVIRYISRKYKTFWTFHDMWAITGGNTYESPNGDWLTGYDGQTHNNQFRHSWRTKYNSLHDTPLTIISPSYWLKKMIKESPTFKNHDVMCIHNGIDENVFKPATEEKKDLRSEKNIPENDFVILFISSNLNDPRKGYHYLKESLDIVYKEQDEKKDSITIVLIGNEKKPLRPLPFNTLKTDKILDPNLIREYYAISDIFLLPSESDNLPSTALESMACGTPVIAFDCGGISDIIDDGKNGFLITAYSTRKMAETIISIINSPEQKKRMAEEARKKVMAHFAQHIQTIHYEQLFLGRKYHD